MAEPLDSLQPFEIPVHTKTAIVTTWIINDDVDPVARKELVDYHPKVDYEITAPILGAGLDAHLKIVPQGGPWSPEQRTLLDKLKFIPAPDKPVPGRARVLYMMRDPSRSIQLGATPWYLVDSRIEKSTLPDGRVVNDVILIWEYRDKMNGKDYLKPVITCWKW